MIRVVSIKSLEHVVNIKASSQFSSGSYGDYLVIIARIPQRLSAVLSETHIFILCYACIIIQSLFWTVIEENTLLKKTLRKETLLKHSCQILCQTEEQVS